MWSVRGSAKNNSKILNRLLASPKFGETCKLMIENTLSRTLRKNAESAWRIYKFSTDNELIEFEKNLKRYYAKSTGIVSTGRLTADGLEFIRNYADDNAYLDLNISCGDLIILTKENLAMKVDDARKISQKKKIFDVYDRAVNSNTNNEKYNKEWSDEEKSLLWSGDKYEVAETLGRTPDAVGYQRSKFMKDNPGFVPPAEAKWRMHISKTKHNKPLVVPKLEPSFASSKTISFGQPDSILQYKNGSMQEVQPPVQHTDIQNLFRVKIGEDVIELPTQPKQIKIGQVEITF
jgi:hypothetical protein